MNKKILHIHAKDENDNLIHVNNAEKGIKYYCADPECKKEIIFRSSGKTGRGSRRPHFSHKKGTNPSCSPERALHEVFKKKLIELIEKHIAEKSPFVFNWNCDLCNNKYTGNLIEKAHSVKEEYVLEECRPDIALLDKEGNVLAVVEIVVTHKPEENVLQYYQDKKITLIQINLTSDEDPSRIEEKAKNPDIVDLCLSPQCPNRDKYIINRTVSCFPGNCARGIHQIAKFGIKIDSVFGIFKSMDFTENELKWVQTNYNKYNSIVTTKKINQQGVKEKFPIMTCWECKRMGAGFRKFRF